MWWNFVSRGEGVFKPGLDPILQLRAIKDSSSFMCFEIPVVCSAKNTYNFVFESEGCNDTRIIV